MSATENSKYLEDSAFQELLVECLERLERDESLDREQLLADHPQFAKPLREFLADQAMLKEVASGVRDSLGRSPAHQPANRLYEETIDSSPRGGSDFSAGETIRYVGEYEILQEIARGGMGVVFKARQQKLGRIVALKMILAGKLADDADVQRFHREARAAGRLKHPNIVPVHEIGEHEGRHYFTMDFVDGRSLADELREESLPPRRAAEIARTAAEAVHFAHQQGTVHRDLKPANVLLTADGSPHITDFGLAKMLESVDEESRAELTATGQILGTPSYMSPEQASGKQELVGPASDIYSLGAILYACLTGRAPFVADSPVDTLLQVMRKEPVSPRELNPSVPKDLETLCLKCLTKEPHKRYGTAQDLADDLNRFLEGRPVLARPVGRINKTLRWCRRNKAVAALMCLLFLSMAVGTYVSASYAVTAVRHAQNEAQERARAEAARVEAENQRRKAELARRDAELQRDVATKAKAQAEWSLSQEAEARRESEMARKAEADARRTAEQSLAKEEAARREAEQRRLEALWQTYIARLQPMMYRWEQREYGQLESMLDLAIPTEEDEPDFRGWEWHYLRNLCRQRTSPIDETSTFDRHFDWHPATQRLAVFRENGLEIWSGDPLEFQTSIAGHSPGIVRFSPNGTQLAVADNFKISIVSVGSGKTTTTIDLAAHAATHRGSKLIKSLDWRPDGAALASGTNMGAIHLWNPENGEPIKPIQSLPNDFPCNDMHWHPSDNVLAVGTRYGYVFAIDTEMDETAWHKKIDRDYVYAVRWNPSGTMVVGATGDGSDLAKFVIWDRDGNEQMRSAQRAITGSPSIDWLDDEQLVVATTDQDIHQFQVGNNEPLQTIRVHDRPVKRILHFGDGRRVISSTAGEIRTTRLDSEVTLAVATTVHKFGIKGISWAPDSRRVATVSWDGLAAITDVQSGEVLHALDGHANGAVNDVAWSPDGLRVASCDHSAEFRIWDPDAGELLLSFHGGPGFGGFNSLAWIDNHKIVGGHKAIGIYNADDGQLVRPITDSLLHFANLAYCPKTGRIAHLGSSQCKIFDIEGRLLAAIGVDADRGLAWSPDGKLLITGGGAGISVIDAMNCKVLTTIRGHAGRVNDACFSPDGSRIASAGSDGTVRIWDRATGAELLILEHGEQKTFTNVAWSPDGSTITAATTGIVVAWNASSPDDSRRPSSLATGIIASVKTCMEEIAELSEAIERNPADSILIRQRADLYSSQLKWDEALNDFECVAELQPSNDWEPISAARVVLMMGDVEDYRKRIDAQVKKFLQGEASKASVTGDYLASTAALAPPPDADLSQLLPLSRAHSDAKGHALWASRGVILLSLRLGNPAAVLELLEKYNGAASGNHAIFLAAACALANHALENTVAASEALAEARELADKTWFEPAGEKPITYSDLGTFVEARVLLDEACKEILGSSEPPEDSQATTDQASESVVAENGEPSAIESELLDDLTCEDAAERNDALKAIQKLGPEAAFAVPQLVKLLEQSDSFEKTQVIRCLGRIGPDAAPAAAQLLEILRSESSLNGSRFEAAQAIARMGAAGEVAIPTLIAILKDPGESVKSYLKKATAPSAQGIMGPLLRKNETGVYTDQRDMILMHVISSLAIFGRAAEDAIPAIERVRDDPDALPAVKQTAEKAIEMISGETSPKT